MAMSMTEGKLVLTNSDFSHIYSALQGGLIYYEGVSAANQASHDNGDIQLEISGCTFVNISAQIDGGVIRARNLNFTITLSHFSDNRAEQGNGGVLQFLCGRNSNFVCSGAISSSTFTNNYAALEGGVIIYNFYEPSISDVTWSGNSA